MDANDLASFKEVAGNRVAPSQRVRELWVKVGRRSGKTRIAAAICCYIAAIEQHKLAPGEIGHVLLIAASRDQAAVAYEYVRGFLRSSPLLRQQIVSETASEVRLKGNIVISVHAGSYRTVRGRTLLAVVGDETSFWRDETSALPDVEVFRAVTPALAAIARACGWQSPRAIARSVFSTRNGATISVRIPTTFCSSRVPQPSSTLHSIPP